MLQTSQFAWLEQNGLALRGPECCDSTPMKPVFRSDIVLKQQRDYSWVIWSSATDSIAGRSAEKAYEEAVKKGAPKTPDQAYSEMAAKDAAASARIAELEAQLKAMSEKASKPSQASK